MKKLLLFTIVFLIPVCQHATNINLQPALQQTANKQLATVPPVQRISVRPVQQLIERITPGRSGNFELQIAPAKEFPASKYEGTPYSIYKAPDGKILLRSTEKIGLCVAYYQYLREYCEVSLSFCGDNLKLPEKLPLPSEKINGRINGKYRSFFNYCSFSYTGAWWNWTDWQRVIDFMAMNGINMPLQVVGLEGVWYNALLRIGYTDQQARQYLCGPAYFAWQWMTNIESFAGPLPKSWIESHIKLGKQITDRELELGMHPIQQGFSGGVPARFKEIYPQANIQMKEDWCGFAPVAQLDPTDPLFMKFGKIFFEEEKKLYGLHGFYATDPFHESTPISTDSSYLHGVAKAVLKLYRETDKNFKYWIMQGWTPTKEIVEAIPKDSLIILDLADPQYTPSKPGEKKFWGYPYLAGNLHNFGGRINMHGDIEALADNQYTMAADDGSPVVGSGIFMEGICQNPLYYDLAFEMPVHQNKADMIDWLHGYSVRRYGYVSDNTLDALIRLWHNPYRRGTNGTEKSSIIAARPALHPKKSGPNSNFGIPYSQDTLIIAEDFLLGCDPITDGYMFDIVDIQRQIMSNLGQGLNKKIAEAFESGNIAEFDKRTAEFYELLTDLDSLVGTRREYSFEDKIQKAHSWATTQQESDLYDFNQSMQVTQWGPVQVQQTNISATNNGNNCSGKAQFDGQDIPQSWYGRDVLFDYSWREWSGLIREYYLPRWQMFYKMLRGKLTDGSWKNYREYEENLPRTSGREAINADDFYSSMTKMEYKWISTPKHYSPMKYGNEYTVAKRMFDKWEKEAYAMAEYSRQK